jgi:hypothetical protein
VGGGPGRVLRGGAGPPAPGAARARAGGARAAAGAAAAAAAGAAGRGGGRRGRDGLRVPTQKGAGRRRLGPQSATKGARGLSGGRAPPPGGGAVVRGGGGGGGRSGVQASAAGVGGSAGAAPRAGGVSRARAQRGFSVLALCSAKGAGRGACPARGPCVELGRRAFIHSPARDGGFRRGVGGAARPEHRGAAGPRWGLQTGVWRGGDAGLRREAQTGKSHTQARSHASGLTKDRGSTHRWGRTWGIKV